VCGYPFSTITSNFTSFTPHAKLLVSIAQLMGMSINGVGDINPNSGPLAGLV